MLHYDKLLTDINSFLLMLNNSIYIIFIYGRKEEEIN